MFQSLSKKTSKKINQSRNLVHLIPRLLISSFVIRTAIGINKAALDDITTPALGFNIAELLELFVEEDVIINITFFYSNSYIFPVKINMNLKKFQNVLMILPLQFIL